MQARLNCLGVNLQDHTFTLSQSANRLEEYLAVVQQAGRLATGLSGFDTFGELSDHTDVVRSRCAAVGDVQFIGDFFTCGTLACKPLEYDGGGALFCTVAGASLLPADARVASWPSLQVVL